MCENYYERCYLATGKFTCEKFVGKHCLTRKVSDREIEKFIEKKSGN
jgi:hypothetical protein